MTTMCINLPDWHCTLRFILNSYIVIIECMYLLSFGLWPHRSVGSYNPMQLVQLLADLLDLVHNTLTEI